MPLDPYGVLRGAPITSETVPAWTYQPPPTAADPTPAPVVVPAATRLGPDLADLPTVLKPGGALDLGAAVAVLWQALHALEIRTVQALLRVDSILENLPPNALLAGQWFERAVTWSSPPPIVPTGVVVRAETSLTNAGRLIAAAKPETLTQTGCTVRVTNVTSVAVTFDPSNPVVVNAQGLYLYTAPLDMEQ